MKNIKILGMLLCLAGVTATLPSCNDSDGSDYVTTQSIPGFFNNYTDIPTGEVATASGVSYTLDFNYTQNIVKVVINGLRLPDGTSYPSLTFDGLPWTLNSKGWKEINVSDIVPSGGNFAAPPHFNSFKFELLDRVIGQTYYPCVNCTYVINNRYSVRSIMSNQIEAGTTKSTSPEGTEFETEDPLYAIALNPVTSLASITINNAVFAANMPPLNMTFEEIPYTVNGENITLRCGSLVPKIGGTPYPSFPITDLEGVITLTEGMGLKFKCEVKGELYSVDVQCRYPTLSHS